MGELLQDCTNFLKKYGYLNKRTEVTSFDDSAMLKAVAKFQRFDANVGLIKEQSTGTPLLPDGVIGGATLLAMAQPRCSCVDLEEEPATGSGGWIGCVRQDTHGCIVSVDQTNLPSFLRPHFRQVLKNVQYAYAQIGMLFVFRDSRTFEDLLIGGRVEGKTHIEFSFTVGDGWIGLAIVGPGSCERAIWCKFDYRYQPSDIVNEWTTLIKHELGHNCGLRHSSGGVMNPSIVRGLPILWPDNDPSTGSLKRWFGGIPIDIPGEKPPPDEPPIGSDWPAPGTYLGYVELPGKRFLDISVGFKR